MTYLRPRRVVLAALVALALSPSVASMLGAQGPRLGDARVGVSRSTSDAAPAVLPRSPAPVGAGEVAGRLAAGTAGAVIGSIVGAVVFSELLPQRSCGDDPGLCEAMLGYAVGGAWGAAIGATTPTGTNPCARRRRFGHALLGALPGVMVALTAHEFNTFLFAPLVSVAGATAAVTICTPAAPGAP